MKRKKRHLRLVYKGRSFFEAEERGLEFWAKSSAKKKLQAMQDLMEMHAAMRGIPKGALRLLRTTAVIKLP